MYANVYFFKKYDMTRHGIGMIRHDKAWYWHDKAWQGMVLTHRFLHQIVDDSEVLREMKTPTLLKK